MDDKKITLELANNEFEQLIQTLFLGNWMINSCRLQEEVLEEYDLIFDKVSEIYVRMKFGDKKETVDVHKHLYEQTEKYMEFYQNAIFFDLLSRKLAEFNFPVNYNDTGNLLKMHNKQQAAKRAYEKELNANSLANLNFNVPNTKNNNKPF